MSTFRLFKLVVFLVQKGVFSVQNIVKKHFTALYCIKKKFQKWPLLEKKAFSWRILRKKKGRKWPFLDQNPLEKCQFSYFMTSCFYSLQRRFFVLKYRKGHFLMLQCLKKKLQKCPFLDQNHGLTTWKKRQFFDFLNLLFLQPRKVFFRSRIS